MAEFKLYDERVILWQLRKRFLDALSASFDYWDMQSKDYNNEVHLTLRRGNYRVVFPFDLVSISVFYQMPDFVQELSRQFRQIQFEDLGI